MNTIEDYNSEPFFYCKRCLSLDIRTDGEGEESVDFCNNCGSSCIEESEDMDEWVDKYNKAYAEDLDAKRFYYSNKSYYKI